MVDVLVLVLLGSSGEYNYLVPSLIGAIVIYSVRDEIRRANGSSSDSKLKDKTISNVRNGRKDKTLGSFS
jgi:hypothetical protein